MQKRAWFGKREEAAPTGQGVAGKAMSHACRFCGKTEGDIPFKQCSGCKAVRYCSKACQADHWKEHKTLFQAISTLADQNYREDRERLQTFVSHLSPQEHAQVIRLVGRKCTVKCLLNGVETKALWDTGAQVSIIPSNWVRKFYPGTDVRNIAELLGMGGLDLKTANGTDLPYKGWVELTFSLAEENSQCSLQVPFLVAKDSLDMPIVGFNVIEEITKQPVDCASAGVGESVVDALSSSLTCVENEKVEALVNLIKTESAQELCSIKSRKQEKLIPKGQSVIVSCRAAIGPVGKVPVLFELDPDSSYPSDLEIPETQLTVTGASTCRVNIRVDNPSKHDVALKGRTVLGRLQQVKSVTPLEVKVKETPFPTADGPSTVDMSSESGSSSNCCTEQSKEEGDFEIKKLPCSHIHSVDTEELSEEQKTIVTIVRKMLDEKEESFSQTDDDVGRAEEL